MGKLEERIALVTGGTSGIGLAAAKVFVEEGAYVYITGRRERELQSAVREIGRHVTAIQSDVAVREQVDRTVAQIEREQGRLDVIFANAGVAANKTATPASAERIIAGRPDSRTSSVHSARRVRSCQCSRRSGNARLRARRRGSASRDSARSPSAQRHGAAPT